MLRHKFAKYFLRRVEDFIKNENVFYWLRFLEKTQQWSREQLDSYRLKQLQKIILHAYQNVPFYKNRFDSIGLSPYDIKCLSDINFIPILSRVDLRQNCDTFLRSIIHDFSRCIKGASSGSSGDPVTYYKDKNALSAQRAATIIGKEMSGWKLGDKTIIILGD